MASELSIWQQGIIAGLQAAVACVRTAQPAVLEDRVQWHALRAALWQHAGVTEADMTQAASLLPNALPPLLALQTYCGIGSAPPPASWAPARAEPVWPTGGPADSDSASDADADGASGAGPRSEAEQWYCAALQDFLRAHGPCSVQQLNAFKREYRKQHGRKGSKGRVKQFLLLRPDLFCVKGRPRQEWGAGDALWSAADPGISADGPSRLHDELCGGAGGRKGSPPEDGAAVPIPRVVWQTSKKRQYEDALHEFLAMRGPCTVAEILRWREAYKREHGAKGTAQKLPAMLLTKPDLFEVRGVPLARWAHPDSRWSALPAPVSCGVPPDGAADA